MLNEHLRSHVDYPQDRFAVLGFTDLGEAAAASPLMNFVTEVGCYLYSYSKIKHDQVLDYTYFWGGRVLAKGASSLIMACLTRCLDLAVRILSLDTDYLSMVSK